MQGHSRIGKKRVMILKEVKRSEGLYPEIFKSGSGHLRKKAFSLRFWS